MNIIAIIPARMGSSRFPGKPLADIHGLPMVLHVALRTRLSRRLSAVYVATCDEAIAQACAAAGVDAIMTSPAHERCSDRTAEALLHIETATGCRADIIVMVQGDEPMVTPQMIDAALAPMLPPMPEYDSVRVVNLMADLTTPEACADPNEVKVVTDCAGNALYFSREAIPSRKKEAVNAPACKQVCIIPFRREALLHFNALPETPLEQIESVDMLRLLEHGEKVRMVHVNERTLSVDTPADLARVREMMRGDALMPTYMRMTQTATAQPTKAQGPDIQKAEMQAADTLMSETLATEVLATEVRATEAQEAQNMQSSAVQAAPPAAREQA